MRRHGQFNFVAPEPTMKWSAFGMNGLRKGTAKELRSTLWPRKRQLTLLQKQGL